MKTEIITDKHGRIELTYDDSQAAKDRIFTMLLAWFKEYSAYDGETICQCDDPQIDAPNILSDVAEKGFKFDPEFFDS